MSQHALRTIVMLGDVGMGKSTIVEKVAGVQGLSSESKTSFTKASRAFVTGDRRLQLIDTPGANAMQDRLEHNVWIAHALSFSPVSLILLVVKADTRMDNVVDAVRGYAERFSDLMELMAVCVTHMDLVSWPAHEVAACIEEELGFDALVFTGLQSSGKVLARELLDLCQTVPPQDLRINSDNFLKYFKIGNSNVKILKSVREEVSRFNNLKKEFMEELNLGCFGEPDKVDLVFEFQAFMAEEVINAQKRVSEANSFTFMGPAMTNEAGHIANLTNQLRATLFDVRTLALGFQTNSGISELRKCPHCGQVWAKLSGCDGETTCGNKLGRFDGRYQDFASFRFTVLQGGRLQIAKLGRRRVVASSSTVSQGNAGCGRTISWKSMAPVAIPQEFRVEAASAVTVEDIQVLPVTAWPRWTDVYMGLESKLGQITRTFCSNGA
eukprot:TRINITY_DN27869_c0_g1_i1.p1 TRINITY_DN27869_c0_g1~~TRINITY_DN27869_c0_g1_i1.p1  ORF type:complete len:439 (+),score=92.38 TRINITY_DN27869_c0_g1_i1:65-1381(+)